MRRFALSLVASLALAGCLDPSHPCDPEADDDVRRTASLAGRVVDQGGAPVADVMVLVEGHSTPAISGQDGSFRFDGLPPNTSAVGYELAAFPDEPLIGGRTIAPAVGCEGSVEGLELVVAVPPATPEVEITQATAADRLLVAFSAVAGGPRYRVEVRAPFSTWREAALASAPGVVEASRADGMALVDLASDTTSDVEAAAFCAAYSYALPALDNENARCAEVIGIKGDVDVTPLEEHGSYEVRVRAEALLDEELAASMRLPVAVLSEASGSPAELTLVPTALLPVMMDPDPTVHDGMMRAMEANAIVPVAEGRFALMGEGMGEGGMMVIGSAEAVAPDAYDGSAAAPQDAMAYDDASPSAGAEITDEGGTGLAILPAGRWVRVWKRYLDQTTSTAKSQVEKVFIGSVTREEDHGEQAEPDFAFDVEGSGLLDELRAFSWLTQPEGTISGVGPYNPPDGYMLLFESGFVLLEREAGGLVGESEPLLDAFADDMADGSLDQSYAAPSIATAAPATTTGLCQSLGGGAMGVDGALGSRTVRVCLDLEGALGQELDLVDVAILKTTPAATAPSETFHVMSDARSDRVLVVGSDLLLGKEGLPLKDVVDEVRVGVRPWALTASRALDCQGGGETPVVLVANRGSLDVSVLEVSVTDDDAGAPVVESAALGVPGVPVRFLDDPDGATCVDPYVWVVLDDGRMVPLDMRQDRLGPPLCGNDACSVPARDRAPVGAVSRGLSGKSRVLVGGRGLLGEVGFLRPSLAVGQ